MNASTHSFALPARGLNPFEVARAVMVSRILGRHRPFWVNVEVTHRCNLRCSFCDKNSPTRQMPASKAKMLLQDLRACGTASICFDGGEPLFHPEIDDIVACAKRLGFRVALSTNGTLIARHRALLANVDALKISIDGPQKVHDAGRGEGTFVCAIEGARIATRAGVPVALRMTLAEHNVEHWAEVVRLAGQLGASSLFQPAIGSVMNVDRSPASHCASVAIYRSAIDELTRLKREGGPIGNEYVCLDHLRRWPDPTLVQHCAGGRVEAAIGPDGSMFPCGRVGRGEPAPNVFELGVAAAFAQTRRPNGCEQCWCTLTLGNCYLYGLDARLLQGRIPGVHGIRKARVAIERSSAAELHDPVHQG
jgi:MoaA/NifB/PqqE/SkfB family radical SAM enzyme